MKKRTKLKRLKRGIVGNALESLYDADIRAEHLDMGIKGSYKNQGTELRVNYEFSHALVLDEMERYYTFSYFYREDPQIFETVQGLDAYIKAWKRFLIKWQDAIDRAMETLHQYYDPVSNYDMKEVSEDGQKHGTKTTVETPDLTETVKADNTRYEKHGAIHPEYEDRTTYDNMQTETDYYKNGFDSDEAPGVHSDRDVEKQTGGQTTRHTNVTAPEAVTDATINFAMGAMTDYQSDGARDDANSTKKTTGSKSTDESYKSNLSLEGVAGNHNITPKWSETQVHYLTRSGNIGVTTSTQLAHDEFVFRSETEVLETFVKKFIDEECVYIALDNNSADIGDYVWEGDDCGNCFLW